MGIINTSYVYHESTVQEFLQKMLSSYGEEVKTEVKCMFGRIDIMTPKTIIEIKEVDSWKSGVGQLICYGHIYKYKKRVLYLFDREGKWLPNNKVKDHMFECCRDNQIYLVQHHYKTPEVFLGFMQKYHLLKKKDTSVSTINVGGAECTIKVDKG